MTSPSSFTTGMQHMQAAIEEGKRKAAAATSGGGNIGYINWKPGDKKIVRFLTDDVLVEDFNEFIVDKAGQTKNFMVPPADPMILERFRSPYPGIGWRKNPKTGALEEPKPRKVGVGIAVLRDEKPGEGGKLVLQDYLYDQEIEGQHYLSRYFGIIQQSVSNFWHTLAVSCFKRYGTICDRDYLIERSGTGLDTKYSIIPLDPDPDLNTVEIVQGFYFYGYQWNKDDPERYLKCPQTLTQWAEYFSSEDRYKHWLTPDAEGAAPQQQAPATASYSPTAPPSTNPLLTPGDQDNPMGEFAAGTTHNPAPETPVQTTAGTDFSSFKDTLLSQAKAQGK